VSVRNFSNSFSFTTVESQRNLARKQQKLKLGFAEMEKKLVALGAIEEYHGDYSHFTAPDGAPEDVKKANLEYTEQCSAEIQVF